MYSGGTAWLAPDHVQERRWLSQPLFVPVEPKLSRHEGEEAKVG
jgi:hypothetical protein